MNVIRSDDPAVWVLIFDRKPTDCEFDRLDLESTCFEQFLLQNVRNDAGPLDVFGGEPAFLELANALPSLCQNACLVNLTTDATSAFVIRDVDYLGLESSLRRSQMPLINSSEGRAPDSRGTQSTSDESVALEKAFSANLVWIEARISTLTQPAHAAKAILESVFSRLASSSNTKQNSPILIVTSRSGSDFTIREPLKCGVAEASINVPLWIRPNLGHACRVQTLTGSFDLLPTIATFLHSVKATDEVSPPNVPEISDLSELEVDSRPLSAEPQSLAFLCGAPQVCSNRIVELRGDSWRAARTDGFMLVVSDDTELAGSETESDGDSSKEPSRRLYVKPDDRFNVNDVSRTYSTVVEELSGVLLSTEKPGF